MSKNYEFTVRGKPRPERPRLMSFLTLAGFGGLVLIPLVFAFVKQDLLLRAERERLGDSLSVSYLTNLLRTEPNNLELRVWLAENKIYLGELKDVPNLIEPVLRSADSDWQNKGLLTMYKYLTKKYALSKRGSVEQAKLMKQRRAIFTELAARALPAPTLVFLAGQAAQLGEREIGIRLYKKITESPTTSPAWCADMAARVLSDGDYELAAFLYFIARHKALTIATQREYLIAGIRALLADSLYTKAMQAADQHLGNLENDPDTLNFLVQAARASNDQEHAARYVRRMLHLSWLERAFAWLRHLDVSIISAAEAAPGADAPERKGGIEPYDSKKYKLAYDVFLENHNLSDALRVAEAAVRSNPGDAAWHRRLAQVAEWLNKPQIALREWLWLLRHHGGKTAVLEVLRLAPALDDYDGALEAWRYMAAERPLNATQWNTVADLFEKTGRQDEGIRFFEARYQRERTPLLLEIAARLAQRNGDDDRAQSLYSRLLRLHGFNSEWVQKTANLYLQKGEYQKAYDLLKRNIRSVDKKDFTYWKLLADLAWQLQRDVDAAKDYRHLAASGNLAQEDFGRLLSLLGDSKQEEVAAFAELAYRKYHDRAMLFRALEIHAARHDLVAEKRLFDSVAADPKVDLSADAHFLLLLAHYLQNTGKFQAARTAFSRAITLAPDDPATITDALWFLIDAHEQPALQGMIAQIVARGEQQNPAYWGALAAAYDVLDQPARAVAYYSRHIRQNGQDFLWLVNYAEALERDRQPALALRVRQHAWQQLRGRLRGAKVGLPFSPDMLAAARLELVNQPGDPGFALVRSVLRHDRLVKHDVIADEQISDLVLGWALSGEHSANAKAWLWRRYGRTLSRPLWADATIAMAENDTQRLGTLFVEQADGLTAMSRADAATALDQLRDAQSIAFDALAADPENDEAYQRFTKDALGGANYVNIDVRRETFGTMHSSVQHIVIDSAIADSLRLAIELQHTYQSDITPPVLAPYPSTEQLAGLALKSRSRGGYMEVGIRRLNEFARYTEAHASYTAHVSPDLDIQIAAQVHGEATESNSLRVFGMRDEVHAVVDYVFGDRAYLSIQPGYAHYYTQKGNYLGRGRLLSWEAGQHISMAYPDLRVALLGINESFGTDRLAAFDQPPSQNLYGACLGFTDEDERTYARVWRPTFDACGTHNNVSGKGYISKAGVAGPVAGHDRLTITFNQEQGGVRVTNGLERVMKLNYRYFFD